MSGQAPCRLRVHTAAGAECFRCKQGSKSFTWASAPSHYLRPDVELLAETLPYPKSLIEPKDLSNAHTVAGVASCNPLKQGPQSARVPCMKILSRFLTKEFLVYGSPHMMSSKRALASTMQHPSHHHCQSAIIVASSAKTDVAMPLGSDQGAPASEV